MTKPFLRERRTPEQQDTFRRTGHFAGCSTHGCEATRCAEARFVAAWQPVRTNE